MKTKTNKPNPMSTNPKAGQVPDDVEIRLGDYWVTASSIAVTFGGSLFWKSSYFLGNSLESTWRWKQ